MRVLVQVALDEEMEFTSSELEVAGWSRSIYCNLFYFFFSQALARKLLSASFMDVNSSSLQTYEMIKTLWAEEALKVIYGERDRLFNLNDGAG